MRKIIDIISKEKTILQFIFIEFLFLLIIPFSTACADLPFFPYLIIFVVCLAIYAMYLLYQVFLTFNKRAYEEQQRKMIVRQKELQNQYILAQMQSSKDMEQLKRILIEEVKKKGIDKKDDLRKIIDEILLEHGDFLALNYSKNKVIDVILYHKILIMKKMHIRYSIDCQVHHDLSLSTYEMMSILNNMLDNAIEACSLLEIKNRYIGVSIRIVTNYLIVKVVNSIKNTDLVLVPGISTKDNKSNHGIGLMVIEHTCKENQGSFYFEIDEKTKRITCIATIMLKKES